MRDRRVLAIGLFTAAVLSTSPGDLSATLQAGGRGGQPVGPDGQCPAGTTQVRPDNCQAPEFPPPSIVDYRPRSTLVTEEHLVPRAKYPVVDIHGHAGNLAAPGTIDNLVAAMDALNIKVYVAADNLTGDRLTQSLAAIQASPHRDRFRVLAGIDFRNIGPGWGERAAQQLERD